jgi:hypothetical protein
MGRGEELNCDEGGQFIENKKLFFVVLKFTSSQSKVDETILGESNLYYTLGGCYHSVQMITITMLQKTHYLFVYFGFG